MAITYETAPGIGRVHVKEGGEIIGYVQSNVDQDNRIRRESECRVHGWSDVVLWSGREPYPGDKQPDHWVRFHGEEKPGYAAYGGRLWSRHSLHRVAVQYYAVIEGDALEGMRWVRRIFEGVHAISRAEKFIKDQSPEARAHILTIDGTDVTEKDACIPIRPS